MFSLRRSSAARRGLIWRDVTHRRVRERGHASRQLRTLFRGGHFRSCISGGPNSGSSAGGGAYVVEVNPERTPVSGLCDEVLTGKAGEILPLLCQKPDR